MARKRRPAEADIDNTTDARNDGPGNSSPGNVAQAAISDEPPPPQVNGAAQDWAARKEPPTQAPSAEMPPAPDARQDAQAAPEQNGERSGRGWVNPYKSLFINQEAGFEMGEDYRFKQRVFTFRDKPTEEVRAMLKEAGFTYRPAEKAWTIPATFANRVTADRIAQSIATGSEKSVQ